MDRSSIGATGMDEHEVKAMTDKINIKQFMILFKMRSLPTNNVFQAHVRHARILARFYLSANRTGIIDVEWYRCTGL
jgi:hypothetical protein